MSLSQQQMSAVEQVLKNALRHKFKTYNPEPASMPFHARLLGKDRMALFSFIHSMNTNFGTSIFEPVALTLAKNRFKQVKTQVSAGEFITDKAQIEIQKIIDNLLTASANPGKVQEI